VWSLLFALDEENILYVPIFLTGITTTYINWGTLGSLGRYGWANDNPC